MKILFNYILPGLLVSLAGCTKFVDAGLPNNELAATTVYQTDATALASMTGLYATLTSNTLLMTAWTTMPAMSADELLNYSNDAGTVQLYSNAISTSANTTDYLWVNAYQTIYMANAALAGTQQSGSLTAPVIAQVEGEAEFMRAFFYFNLVNEFGGVPLVTTTNYQTNEAIKRSSVAEVYAQIIADLQDAQGKLTSGYLDGNNVSTNERIRPNKGAAQALLARAYLYTQQWASADSLASIVIANSGQYSLVADLNSVFLANSNEAIWQIQPAGVGGEETPEGTWYILSSDPSNNSTVTGGKIAALSAPFLNAFEPGDNRLADWVDSLTDNTTNPATTYYFPFKYKIGDYGNNSVTEYSMELRLAEQYLIRAEAKIQEGQIDAGIADLNVLRGRARAAATVAVPNPLPALAAGLSKADALTALVQERRIELFAECGHRWNDLKRMAGLVNPSGSLADEVMPAVTAAKGGVWNDEWELYPVPLTDMQSNVDLSQNPGYQQ
jgi:starch-binding outer membrane protein, SusD/RagB family